MSTIIATRKTAVRRAVGGRFGRVGSVIAAIGVAIGAVTFFVAHLIETTMWDWFGGVHEPWFLNSGRAVAFTAACFFVAGALVGSISKASRAEDLATASVRRGAYIGAGGTVAAIIVLFWQVGPGSLFPIVIVVGAVILTVSSTAGVSVHWAAKRRAARRA